MGDIRLTTTQGIITKLFSQPNQSISIRLTSDKPVACPAVCDIGEKKNPCKTRGLKNDMPSKPQGHVYMIRRPAPITGKGIKKLRFIIQIAVINWRTYCEWWSVSSGQVLKNDVTICDWDISWGNETSAYKINHHLFNTWYGNGNLMVREWGLEVKKHSQ